MCCKITTPGWRPRISRRGEAAEDKCQPASEACLPDVEDRSPEDRAEDIADRVGTEMECQAAHEEDRKGYPASDLEAMERGSRSYLPYVPSFQVSATGGDKNSMHQVASYSLSQFYFSQDFFNN